MSAARWSTSTMTFTVAAVADSPILRMADASVLGLTLSSADNASVPAGTSSSAVVTVPQVLALRGGGYAATVFVQDGTNSIFDIYLQVFGANGQPSGALLPFDGPEIVVRVPLAQITDGRFMAAWHRAIGDPAPISYRMFNADGTPATGVLTFGAPATIRRQCRIGACAEQRQLRHQLLRRGRRPAGAIRRRFRKPARCADHAGGAGRVHRQRHCRSVRRLHRCAPRTMPGAACSASWRSATTPMAASTEPKSWSRRAPRQMATP